MLLPIIEAYRYKNAFGTVFWWNISLFGTIYYERLV